MKDTNRIKIAQIEKLKMIYFYDAESSFHSKKNLIGLNISYDNNKSLSYDYKSPYFEEFLTKVLVCYQAEGKQALLLGEFTENLVNKLLNHQIIQETKTLSTHALFYESLLEKNVFSGYLCDLARSFLSLHVSLDNIEITDVMGFHGQYNIYYNYLSKNLSIPIIITPTAEENVYDFKMSIYDLEHDIIDSCTGKIRHSEERVYMEWFSKKTSVCGNALYSPEKNYNEATLSYQGKAIDIEQMLHKVSVEEKQMLDSYSRLLHGKEFDKIIPTVQDQYLLHGVKQINGNNIQKDYCHMTILDDVAIIKKKKILGKYMEEKDLFFPIMCEKENIVIIPVTIHNNEYLLLQHHYLNNSNMTGDYINHKKNKYFYELAEITPLTNLKESFQVKSIVDITNNVDLLRQLQKEMILAKGEKHETISSRL